MPTVRRSGLDQGDTGPMSRPSSKRKGASSLTERRPSSDRAALSLGSRASASLNHRKLGRKNRWSIQRYQRCSRWCVPHGTGTRRASVWGALRALLASQKRPQEQREAPQGHGAPRLRQGRKEPLADWIVAPSRSGAVQMRPTYSTANTDTQIRSSSCRAAPWLADGTPAPAGDPHNEQRHTIRACQIGLVLRLRGPV